MLRKKSGFTIVELLIVVIIIGVLATLAIPQFSKAVEKAKFSKAVNMIGLITKAQAMKYAEDDTYSAVIVGDLDGFVDGVVEDDGDWDYACTGDQTTFSCTGDRQAGTYNACVVTATGTVGGATSITAPAANCVKALP
jgi:prepilin-type N-terminal cleavage/methylation domain-containing protein